MQMTFEFFQPAAEIKTASTDNPVLATIENLNSYIKYCGLIAYKDFYMKIKSDLVAIPAGITKLQYLEMAREVYESRAAKVNRDKSRAKYFAIRNKNKK